MYMELFYPIEDLLRLALCHLTGQRIPTSVEVRLTNDQWIFRIRCLHNSVVNLVSDLQTVLYRIPYWIDEICT